MNKKEWDIWDEANREYIRKAFEEARQREQAAADNFWDNLSYEDRCNAFHAVVQRLVKGDITIKGSYRYVLYDVFDFGPEMYSRGMDCGYMALHNAIVDNEPVDGEKYA